MNTSNNKTKPSKITSSDRKINMAKAAVHTTDFSLPESQYAKECKTKISANIFGNVRVE